MDLFLPHLSRTLNMPDLQERVAKESKINVSHQSRSRFVIKDEEDEDMSA